MRGSSDDDADVRAVLPSSPPFVTMVSTPRTQSGDPALAPFLDAPSDSAAAIALEQVLGGELDRVIRSSVRREIGGSASTAAHLDDVVSEVRVSLVRRLWVLRRGRGEPIDDLQAYAARAAEHGCYSLLRKRYPERSRLRNRVRYATSHHPSMILERDEAGIYRCRTRQAVRRAAETGAREAFMARPARWAVAQKLDPAAPIATLLDQLLARLDGPIELDRLVDALAEWLGVHDTTPATTAPGETDRLAEVADPSPTIGDVLEQRESLRAVWKEIVTLPARQRAALLLNLRDPDGGAVLHLLPSTGVVSQPEIAAALELTVAQLTDLWSKMPLDDLSIAASMGISRQQVINLRKSARARLSRRLQGVES
jgi:RNA polymerase sigma factor (sigma-70 family)